MRLNELLGSAKRSIAKNDLESAFGYIDEALSEIGTKDRNILLVLKQRHTLIRRDLIIGINDPDSAWNELSFKVLQYIDALAVPGIHSISPQREKEILSRYESEIDSANQKQPNLVKQLEKRLNHLLSKTKYNSASISEKFAIPYDGSPFFRLVIGVYYVWLFLFSGAQEKPEYWIYVSAPILVWISTYVIKKILIRSKQGNRFARAYANGDYRRTLKLSRQLLKREGDFEKLALLHTAIANSAFNLRNYDEALLSLSKIYKLVEDRSNIIGKETLSECFEISGLIEYNREDLSVAAPYLYHSFHLDKRFKVFRVLYDIYIQLNMLESAQTLLDTASKKTNSTEEWNEIKKLEKQLEKGM